MALNSGNLGTATDSPVLVVVSAVAIAIVFILVMLLIILRARHMAYQRQEAMRLRDEWEMRLILRFKDKPAMHEVWLSSIPSSTPPVTRMDGKEKLKLNPYEWSRLMPLFASDNGSSALSGLPSETATYTVGVLLQLPRPQTVTGGHVADAACSSPGYAPSGSEILFGVSVFAGGRTSTTIDAT